MGMLFTLSASLIAAGVVSAVFSWRKGDTPILAFLLLLLGTAGAFVALAGG